MKPLRNQSWRATGLSSIATISLSRIKPIITDEFLEGRLGIFGPLVYSIKTVKIRHKEEQNPLYYMNALTGFGRRNPTQWCT
ncbi:hypothetical protein L484_027482 [Morus notabilis]|uniref:Uncharacterized protein n=1 Tax=Morus notabilis TaxID=981085 RepID=W9SMG2_9ROSA|nr:hypothetical protein L484_027482 [Morus notabilis]